MERLDIRRREHFEQLARERLLRGARRHVAVGMQLLARGMVRSPKLLGAAGAVETSCGKSLRPTSIAAKSRPRAHCATAHAARRSASASSSAASAGSRRRFEVRVAPAAAAVAAAGAAGAPRGRTGAAGTGSAAAASGSRRQQRRQHLRSRYR